jgi:pentatricopeptide repeat protein
MTINTYPNRKTDGKPSEYREALKLAEAGRCEEALTCIQEYLASAPNDAEALNDTGAILFSLGHTQEAINHLVKAKNLYGDSAEIIWNLVEAYLAAGKAEQAVELFSDMERVGILNVDVLNRTAEVFLNNNNLSDTVKMLERSLEISPEQDILHSMIKVIRDKIAENPCGQKTPLFNAVSLTEQNGCPKGVNETCL